jgi:hypothetical protein
MTELDDPSMARTILGEIFSKDSQLASAVRYALRFPWEGLTEIFGGATLDSAIDVALPDDDDTRLLVPGARDRLKVEARKVLALIGRSWLPTDDSVVIAGRSVARVKALHATLPVRGADVTHAVLWADEAFARYLEEHFGEPGADAATKRRTAAIARAAALQPEDADFPFCDLPELWRGWFRNGTSPAAERIAALVWTARIRPELESGRGKATAISATVLHALADVHSRGVRVEGGTILSRAGMQIAEWKAPPEIAALPVADASAIATLALSGVEALASPNGSRALLWQIVEGNRRAADERIREPSRIQIEGGFSAFAALAGLTEIRGERPYMVAARIIAAQAFGYYRLPGGYKGNLLSFMHREGGPGHHAQLVLRLGDPLLPNWVITLDRSKRELRDARHLIHVPEVLPAPANGVRVYGAELALWWQFLASLRAGARDLSRPFPGVRISEKEIAVMAERAGLNPVLLARVLEVWTADGESTPAMLERHDGFWNFGKAWPRHREALVESGRLSDMHRQRALTRGKKLRNDK